MKPTAISRATPIPIIMMSMEVNNITTIMVHTTKPRGAMPSRVVRDTMMNRKCLCIFFNRSETNGFITEATTMLMPTIPINKREGIMKAVINNTKDNTKMNMRTTSTMIKVVPQVPRRLRPSVGGIQKRIPRPSATLP